MRAAVVSQPGGPEVLRWTEVADPRPGPTEVCIDVVAAGVNRADLLQRRGGYPPPPGAPEHPGLECSGRISAVGEQVTGRRVGEAVCALLPGGGYAERVAVDAGLVLPVPDGVSPADAAGLPEVAATVWSNVYQLAGLSGGQTLLVHGGAGGIGTFAVQLGHATGARVCTTARRDHHDALRALGATLTIDYRDQDFVAEVTARFPDGADVILDNMGAAYLDRNLAALTTGGHLAVIGTQGGRRAELDFGAIFAKRAVISGTTLRARPLAERRAIIAAVGEHVWPLVAAGQVRPVIADRVPMSGAARGHRLLEAGGILGKVLLTVD